MTPIRLAHGFLTVGLWTFASRILGFARDILIAAFLGAGPVAEAFLVAFALPNLFRRFFAEGAFNMAFVPLFSKKLEAGEDAGRFASDAFALLLAVTLGVTALALVFMPGLVLVMASGFAADGRLALAVALGRVAFPYIAFISLAALLSGVLNASGRFLAAAAAPLLLNVVFIAALLLGALGAPPSGGAAAGGLADPAALAIGRALAWAVPVAGAAQLALVWWAAARAGYPIRLRRPRMTPELRRLALIAAPAALAGGVVQVNLLIGRQVASFFDGAIAWLSYADRLYQLPLGVVGIAIGVVLLPALSRRLRAGDVAGSAAAFNRAGEMALALTVPAAVALAVIPGPLVSVLFERGAFGPEDVRATALAVAVYGLGLPAFVLQKVLQPLFYAREDTRRPLAYALVALAVNAGLAVGLAPVLGYIAAAVGTTVAGWVMAWQLHAGARGFGEAARVDARLRARAGRIVAASLAMGAVLFVLARLLAPWLEPGAARYPALAGLVLGGMAAYALAAHLLGAVTTADLRAALRR